MIKYIKEIIKTIRYCIQVSWKTSKLFTVLRLMFSLITPFITLGITYATKKLIDLLTNQNFSFHLYLFLGFYICLRVINTVLQKFNAFIQQLYNDKVTKYIDMNVLKVASIAKLEKFDDPKYYDNLQMVKRDSFSFVQVLWQTISCISSVITLAYTIVLLIKCNVWLLILFIFSALPSAIMNQKYTKSLYRLSLDQLNGERQLGHVFSILTTKRYAQDVRVYNIGEYLFRYYENLWQSMFFYRKSMLKKRFQKTTLLDLLNFSVYVSYIFFIVSKIMKNIFSLSDYVFYTGLLDQLLGGIYSLSSSIIQIYENSIKVSNVNTFLANSKQDIVQNEGKSITQIRSIEFRNVSFRYPSTEEMVLQNINFKINAGSKVALIGQNGAGKSTIIKLLLGLYDNYEGNIFINNIDLRTINKNSLYKQLSLCFQKPTIYGFDIKDNVTVGTNFIYDEEKVKKALYDSELYDVVSKLEKGVNTCLTKHFDQNGVELSDGQYQKLSLARMFYKEASVLIMDEPTSAIDPEAESKIFDRLDECKDRIVFYVSHRLSNLSISDVIIVMNHGKIENIGPHIELMKDSDIYRRIFECQAEKYEKMNQ